MTSGAETYAARVAAVIAQQARLQDTSFDGTAVWDRMARQFRMDPRREVDANQAAIAAFVKPEDVVIDVGGGAGRRGLPLALSCRELVNVEPSPGMGAEFTESAKEANITNARLVTADWLDGHGVVGDVTVICNVTYFVSDIVRFVEKLVGASRRRVIIGVWSTPPPNGNATMWPAIFGEAQAPVPGHRELMPVLWEMGILPDVHVLPAPRMTPGPMPQTRPETIEAWLANLRPKDRDSVRARLDGEFDTLFVQTPNGFAPANCTPAKEVLITWETGRG